MEKYKTVFKSMRVCIYKHININLKCKVDGVNKLQFWCISCGFETIMGIDKGYLDDYIKELSIKVKLCHYLLNEKSNKEHKGIY